MKTALIIFSAFLMLLLSCDDGKGPANPGTTQNEDLSKIISGSIIAENGSPLAGATIECGGINAQTDAEGFFKLTGAADKNGIYLIKISKPGFYDNFKEIRKSEAGATNFNAALKPKELVTTFSQDKNFILELSDGAGIGIVPGTIINESTGQSYNGKVKLYSYYYGRNDEEFADFFPKAPAKDKDGNDIEVFDLGIYSIELFSENDDKLNIADGMAAIITIPVPEELAAAPPAEIPTWHFDSGEKVWKESGIASYDGTSGLYIAEVGHFSFIKLGRMTANRAVVAIRVFDCNSEKIEGAVVNFGSYQETTDETGEVVFIGVPIEISPGVPAKYKVKVSAKMNSGMKSREYVVENLNSLDVLYYNVLMESSNRLTGKLTDCEGKSLTGRVAAKWGNGGKSASYVEGAFSLPVPMGTFVTLQAGAFQNTYYIPVSCEATNAGEIMLDRATGNRCSGPEDEEPFVNLVLDGKSYKRPMPNVDPMQGEFGLMNSNGVSFYMYLDDNEESSFGGVILTTKPGTYELEGDAELSFSLIDKTDLYVSEKSWGASGSFTIQKIENKKVWGSFSGKLVTEKNGKSKAFSGNFILHVME
jgi:hypothetical protein